MAIIADAGGSVERFEPAPAVIAMCRRSLRWRTLALLGCFVIIKSMKRPLLFARLAGLAALLALAVVGGAVPEERITILTAKVLRLQLSTPTQGYQPYARRDVILVGGKVQ